MYQLVKGREALRPRASDARKAQVPEPLTGSRSSRGSSRICPDEVCWNGSARLRPVSP